MRTVSVILPTFNEVENIIPLVKRIITTVTHLHEVFIMDDNSPDHTADVVRTWKTHQKKGQIVNLCQTSRSWSEQNYHRWDTSRIGRHCYMDGCGLFSSS